MSTDALPSSTLPLESSTVRRRWFGPRSNWAAAPDERLPRRLFAATFLFYVLYQLFMQPNWLLGGEMWAEMATNYFPNGTHPNLWLRFFATDAGYVPLPQRLLAATGGGLKLSAAATAFFYTWSAVLLTAAIVGAFCLAPFRAVLRSDGLRFTVVLAVLVVADFETRTFINFTYFAAFLVTVVAALACMQRDKDVPRWAWCVPLLVVSKPAVLAALPAVVVAALWSRSRFRWIAAASVVLSVAQLIRMAVSRSQGVMPAQVQDIPATAKLIAGLKYFAGLSGQHVFGDRGGPTSTTLILLGIGFWVLAAFVFRRTRHPAWVLALFGSGLLLFNMLLNAFALSDSWNVDMKHLAGPEIFRHVVVGFFGSLLLMASFAAALSESQAGPRTRWRHLGIVLFVVWLALSGWLGRGWRASHELGSPVLQSSHWQRMAHLVDSPEPALCVPIDPFSWGVYGRQCEMLNTQMSFGQEYRTVQPLSSGSGPTVLEWSVPESMAAQELMSFGILLRPGTRQSAQFIAEAVVTSHDGQQMVLHGDRFLPAAGGMLLLNGLPGKSIKAPKTVRLSLSQPADVRYNLTGTEPTPSVLWMGRRMPSPP